MRRFFALRTALIAAPAALGLTLAAAAPAQADMTLEQFRDYSGMPGGGPLVRSYLGGLRDGIVMLQDKLAEQAGVAPSFCPDGNELKTGTTFEDMLFAEIENPTGRDSYPADMQLAEVVTLALQANYPCQTF